MALVVADDGLFAAPYDRRGPLEAERREREQRLHRQILAAAERAADLRIADRYRVLVELQHRRDLAQVLVQPLPGRLDDERLALVVRDPGVGLQVRVLLPRRRERAAEHYVRAGERVLDVAFANLLVQQDVRAAGRVHQLRVRLERAQRVADDRKIGVLHLDERCTARRGCGIVGHHERHAVAGVAHALAAQHFLIGVDQAVVVVRNVRGGQHRNHAGERERAGRVDAVDRRVRAVREHRFAVQHVATHEICGIASRARHLRVRVGPRDGRADQAHTRTASGCGSSSCSSRAARSCASRILR